MIDTKDITGMLAQEIARISFKIAQLNTCSKALELVIANKHDSENTTKYEDVKDHIDLELIRFKLMKNKLIREHAKYIDMMEGY